MLLRVRVTAEYHLWNSMTFTSVSSVILSLHAIRFATVLMTCLCKNNVYYASLVISVFLEWGPRAESFPASAVGLWTVYYRMMSDWLVTTVHVGHVFRWSRERYHPRCPAPTRPGQPGTLPRYSPGKSRFAPFRSLFWSARAIIALIAFTKCSPFSRINRLTYHTSKCWMTGKFIFFSKLSIHL